MAGTSRDSSTMWQIGIDTDRNNIVSGYFASNYVGVDAMTAVGLYAPVNMLLSSISSILFGGSVILCGKYLGRNEHDKLQNLFSVNIVVSAVAAMVIFAILAFLSVFDLTGFFTSDPVVRSIFDRFLLDQTPGILPMIIGNQLPAFLSVESKSRRTLAASTIYHFQSDLQRYFRSVPAP